MNRFVASFEAKIRAMCKSVYVLFGFGFPKRVACDTRGFLSILLLSTYDTRVGELLSRLEFNRLLC